MYAVILNKRPIYIGNNPSVAIDKFNDNQGSDILKIKDIEEIKKIIDSPITGEDYFSSKTKSLLSKLENLDNKNNKKIKKETKVQVRTLGPRKVIDVGEGFINIKKEAKEKSEE